jgi:hypothetical protein
MAKVEVNICHIFVVESILAFDLPPCGCRRWRHRAATPIGRGTAGFALPKRRADVGAAEASVARHTSDGGDMAARSGRMMIEGTQSIRESSPRILYSAMSFWRAKPARYSHSHTRTASSRSRNGFTSGTLIMKLHQRPLPPSLMNGPPSRGVRAPRLLRHLWPHQSRQRRKVRGAGQEGMKPSGPRASGLYALIDSAGDRVIEHAPMGGDARGVFVNDALVDHRAFVLVGIPRESRCGSTFPTPETGDRPRAGACADGSVTISA